MQRLHTTQVDLNTKEAPVLMFSYFLASENRQTFFYTGDIASLKHLIRIHGDNLFDLERECTKVLLTMYREYYSDVEVEVKTKPIDDGNQHQIQFRIKIVNESGLIVNVLKEFTLDQYINESTDIYKQELR